ncbi:MAG: hypothetical protein WDW38_001577 [Sanguina aurantia]
MFSLPPVRPISLFSSTPIQDLSTEHIGSYYTLQSSLIPEAFKAFHASFYAPRDAGSERSGGCSALQAELALTNGVQRLMYRRATRELVGMLQHEGLPRVLLEGPVGSGKSIALLSLVEWARASGWMVMYVPTATMLTRGGLFVRREDGIMYDTIISAQHILKSMVDVHGPALRELTRRDGRGNLLDLAVSGLASDDNVGGPRTPLILARSAVESCIQLRQELQRCATPERPFLVAIDDYNALHWTTEYGTAAGKDERRLLSVAELSLVGSGLAFPPPSFCQLARPRRLSLASSFRLIDGPLQPEHTHVVAAMTTRRISPKLHVPTEGTRHYSMPRFDKVEVAHALCHYHDAGLAPELPSLRQVEQMLAITNGNAGEVRQLAVKMSLLKMNSL